MELGGLTQDELRREALARLAFMRAAMADAQEALDLLWLKEHTMTAQKTAYWRAASIGRSIMELAAHPPDILTWGQDVPVVKVKPREVLFLCPDEIPGGIPHLVSAEGKHRVCLSCGRGWMAGDD